MRNTSEKNKNGNGKGEYNPEVEFHYQEDVDVWVEIQDGIEKITYTDEVSKKLKELEEDSESDANSNN